MPILRTKDAIEAKRFCRRLVERGYRPAPAIHHLRQPREGTFRVYRERNRGKETRWIRVAYYEPRRGPFSRIPQPLERQPRGAGIDCVHDRRHGKAYSRGLCANCYHRWKYWQNHEHRRRLRARCKARRDGAREVA